MATSTDRSERPGSPSSSVEGQAKATLLLSLLQTSSDGTPWRAHLMISVLRSLEAYAQLMNDATSIVLDVLGRAAKAGTMIDLHEEIGNMTLQVVGTSAFG